MLCDCGNHAEFTISGDAICDRCAWMDFGVKPRKRDGAVGGHCGLLWRSYDVLALLRHEGPMTTAEFVRAHGSKPQVLYNMRDRGRLAAVECDLGDASDYQNVGTGKTTLWSY